MTSEASVALACRTGERPTTDPWHRRLAVAVLESAIYDGDVAFFDTDVFRHWCEVLGWPPHRVREALLPRAAAQREELLRRVQERLPYHSGGIPPDILAEARGGHLP